MTDFRWITVLLAANPDGSFQMVNSRNGFSKSYAAHK